MDIDGYILALRVINPRNKSGIIKLTADLLKEHPKADIQTDVIDKLYPEDRRRPRRRN